MTDWGAVEDALRAWVVSASGLDAARVYFDNQDGNAPDDAAFATLSLGDETKIGMPEHTSVADSPSAGQMTITAKDVETVIAEVSFYTPGVTTGASTARNLASKCSTALGLQSVRGPLNDAGIGVLRVGPVRWVPSLVNRTNWEGRAILEVELCVRLAATEAVGYIAQVVGSLTVSDGNAATVIPFQKP